MKLAAHRRMFYWNLLVWVAIAWMLAVQTIPVGSWRTILSLVLGGLGGVILNRIVK